MGSPIPWSSGWPVSDRKPLLYLYFVFVLDSADVIDVRLRLRGWTYSEPLSNRLAEGGAPRRVTLRSQYICTP